MIDQHCKIHGRIDLPCCICMDAEISALKARCEELSGEIVKVNQNAKYSPYYEEIISDLKKEILRQDEMQKRYEIHNPSCRVFTMADHCTCKRPEKEKQIKQLEAQEKWGERAKEIFKDFSSYSPPLLRRLSM